jgi:hypothetical protein
MVGGVRKLELFASIGQSQEVWLSLIAEEINEEGDASHAWEKGRNVRSLWLI